jgi:putative transposase
MNNRDYKKFAPQTAHHIYNRGVGKQDIFLDDEDRKFFLYRLKENLFPEIPKKLPDGHLLGSAHTLYIRKMLPKNAFNLFCYCLMPNHFHLMVRQNLLVPVSKLISKVCTSYGKYFNKKYNRVGGVFQDQFKSVLVATDGQMLWLSAYIHQNPAVAGLVKDLKDYPWSSYLDYIGLRKGSLCDKDFIVNLAGSPHAYKKFVGESFDKIKERKDIEHSLLDN